MKAALKYIVIGWVIIISVILISLGFQALWEDLVAAGYNPKLMANIIMFIMISLILGGYGYGIECDKRQTELLEQAEKDYHKGKG